LPPGQQPLCLGGRQTDRAGNVRRRGEALVTLGVLVPEPLVVPATSPYRTLQDLIADAKARPGALNFGTTGNGSMPHLAGEQFRAAAGLDMVQIAYNSG
jgi:tripartite-type tricarboxylate transporter receptor subunit TctC